MALCPRDGTLRQKPRLENETISAVCVESHQVDVHHFAPLLFIADTSVVDHDRYRSKTLSNLLIAT